MTNIKNPFVVGTYVSPEYFCDREAETATLRKHMENGRNVALIAPRRMGKTGLIHHFLQNRHTQNEYYTFFIDLYSTTSLCEMVQRLASRICEQLQPKKQRWWERFSTIVSSLSIGLSIDPHTGQPSFNISLGQIHSPEHSLEEIFKFLETADKECIVAIDEFQQIENYEEKNIEALLRTMMQSCSNTHFIFAGSKRHTMTMMFNSPSRPFYQSTLNMSLEPLPLDVYTSFCQSLFEKRNKHLDAEVISQIYKDYEGYTWFMHMLLNELFFLTDEGATCTLKDLQDALNNIVISQQQAYKEQMALIPIKQKMVLLAIAEEGKATGVTSSSFVKKHSLPSTSSVQSAIKGLLEKELITHENGSYCIYDFFFAAWLKNSHL